MKKILVVVLLVAVAVSCFALSACNKNEEVLVGYDIDMAKALGEELGIEIVFQRISWAQKETELSSNAIDCIWNGMTINEERATAMEISTPYMVNKQVIIIRKSDASKYTTLESMVSSRFTAESGSAGETAIKENDLTKGSVFAGIAAQVDILTELVAGTSDIGVMDRVMADYYISLDSSFSSKLMLSDVDIVEEDENYGIALRKGELALLDKINTALYALQENGKAAEIAERYGLTDVVLDLTYESQWESIEDKASWDYIRNKGTLVVGYTLFAPIAFMQEA